MDFKSTGHSGADKVLYLCLIGIQSVRRPWFLEGVERQGKAQLRLPVISLLIGNGQFSVAIFQFHTIGGEVLYFLAFVMEYLLSTRNERN